MGQTSGSFMVNLHNRKALLQQDAIPLALDILDVSVMYDACIAYVVNEHWNELYGVMWGQCRMANNSLI